MKKILSLTLALIFAVMAFAAVSVSATDEDPLDANLVIHYDFEGEDILAAIEDKAPSGYSKDDLSPISGAVNFSGLMIDTVKGTAHNTNAASGLRAVPSADTNAVTGASTWFIRAKYNSTNGKDAASVVEMRTFGSNSNRPFGFTYNWTSKKIGVFISPASEPSKVQNFNFDYEYDMAKYMNVAIVVDQAEVEGATVYVANVYVSLDLPQVATEWTHLGTKTIGAAIAVPNEMNNLNLLSTGSANCGMTATIDDVRLYNKALTLDEIATIIPNGSFDDGTKQPVDNGDSDNSDDTPEDTTAKTTVADTTEASIDGAVADTTAAEETKKGCKGAVGMGALVVAALATTAVVVKKKEK